MRKKIVAGNWKMNCSLAEAQKLASEVVNIQKDELTGSVTDVVLIPPFIHVSEVLHLSKGSNTRVGVQNCYHLDSGAYTGEISAAILSSYPIQYVIVGHSERRQYFHEDNALLAQKVDACLNHHLTPIYCCGETLEQREKNEHFAVNESQVREGLFHLSEEQIKRVVIAYEPVWAIGTGKTASSAQAQEIHAAIRKSIAAQYGQDVAENISILYGGSVKPDNARELFSQPDIDGGLIGGASLKSRDFIEIAKSF